MDGSSGLGGVYKVGVRLIVILSRDWYAKKVAGSWHVIWIVVTFILSPILGIIRMRRTVVTLIALSHGLCDFVVTPRARVCVEAYSDGEVCLPANTV